MARLTAFADAARTRAALLPPGAERDGLLEKVRQADLATRMNDLFGAGFARQPT